MSESKFQLTVVSPDKCLVRDLEIKAVGAKGTEGDFTALPGHIPFLTDLKPGLMWYRVEAQGPVEEILIGGGFVEVLPDKVTVLADSAERPDEIDPNRAEQSRLRAIEAYNKAKEKAQAEGRSLVGDIEIEKAELKIRKAVARIKASKKPGRVEH
ncbi:MAG: ATP synthase F1 subunit epsilon [Deltaproteobacteria bacterium]|jgi:F-type H+-transporting ATPase subunit epsilon|nr:ATP synthase F1 subunit epsilon [Deltaproteobacteria bacterium]